MKIAEEFGLIIFSDEIYDRLVMDGLKHISIASIAPKNVFCVTFSGLSKSHMIAGFRVGWMVLSGNKKAAAGYIEGIKMLSNMRLCFECTGTVDQSDGAWRISERRRVFAAGRKNL